MLRFMAIASLLVLAWAGPVQAQTLVQFGWAHIRPQTSNRAPDNRLRDHPALPLFGVEERFRSPSVSVDTDSVNTLAVAIKHFLGPHWAINLMLGLPPEVSLEAEGTVGPTGPLRPTTAVDLGDDGINPIASARQWSPALMLEYHFRPVQSVWRPFLAGGVSYNFFTDVTFNDRFEARVDERFGGLLATLAGEPGATRLDAEIDPQLSPIVWAGLEVKLSPRWRLSGALAYLPLETDAHVRLRSEQGTELATSDTRLRFDPFIVGLLAGYRF